MLLNIGDYRITDDPLNFTVHKVGIMPEKNRKGEVNKHAGSERLTLVGHFGTMKDAMMRIVLEGLHSDELINASSVITALNESTARIVLALDKYKGGKYAN